MAGQGSAGNVIAALCSFFIPGLGQLLQGRLLMAIIQFVLAAVMWIVLLGWLIHLWSILDAALYKPRANAGLTTKRSLLVRKMNCDRTARFDSPIKPKASQK